MTESVTVIVSVYNNAEALKKALWGYAAQEYTDFRLILADDGSAQSEIDEVRAQVDQLGLSATHLWHEDLGFRKASILNKAILCAESEKLIFVDADVIPRGDFVGNHVRLLRRGYFIAGGSHMHLPEAMQSKIEREHVDSGELFTFDYFQDFDIDDRKFRLRLEKYGMKAKSLDAIFRRSNAFMGCNASCWKKDAVAVNGFDENWGYGGTDIEFGMRMTNNGVKSKRHSFSLIVLHLEHPRPYRDQEKVKENKRALKRLAKSDKARVESGFDGHSLDKITVLYET